MPIKLAPIERIFRELVKRKMTPAERKVLLGKLKKDSPAKKATNHIRGV
jgi:hypothetical protein